MDIKFVLCVIVLICTCVVVSGESDAMPISSLQNLSSGFLLEGVCRESIHNILHTSIHAFIVEVDSNLPLLFVEHPMNPTSISRLRQFQTVSPQIMSGRPICEFKYLSRIKGFYRLCYRFRSGLFLAIVCKCKALSLS